MPEPTLVLRGPSKSDNKIYLGSRDQGQALFTVQFNSDKPQVRLSRLLPPPQPGQELTQVVGSATIVGNWTEKVTLKLHDRELKVPEFHTTSENKPFDSPFSCGLGSTQLVWKHSSSGHSLELWDKQKTVKIAKFSPRSWSDKETELMMYLPVRNLEEERFLDMVVLTVMAVDFIEKKDSEIGSGLLQAVLGL